MFQTKFTKNNIKQLYYKYERFLMRINFIGKLLIIIVLSF